MLFAWNLGAFLAALLIFHVSEFLLAMIFMRDELGWKSWLLSRGYCLAMTFAVAEYFLELWLIPGLKATWWWEPQGLIALLGLAMVLAGEMVRKTAMVTAGRNFTHLIKQTKRPEHVLVTEGIYAHVRHPGYLGWSIWAVGTQLMLVNPVSTVIFTFVAWKFFRLRIQYEEYYLNRLFPEYADYASRTPTWMPFIQ